MFHPPPSHPPSTHPPQFKASLFSLSLVNKTKVACGAYRWPGEDHRQKKIGIGQRRGVELGSEGVAACLWGVISARSEAQASMAVPSLSNLGEGEVEASTVVASRVTMPPPGPLTGGE